MGVFILDSPKVLEEDGIALDFCLSFSDAIGE